MMRSDYEKAASVVHQYHRNVLNDLTDEILASDNPATGKRIDKIVESYSHKLWQPTNGTDNGNSPLDAVPHPGFVDRHILGRSDDRNSANSAQSASGVPDVDDLDHDCCCRCVGKVGWLATLLATGFRWPPCGGVFLRCRGERGHDYRVELRWLLVTIDARHTGRTRRFHAP